MKNLILFFSLLALTLTSQAQSGKLGGGVILGDPTGLSGKYFMGNDAVDVGLAYGSHEFILYGDYLRHFPGVLGKENAFIAALNPYVGLGPVFAFGDNDKDHSHHFINDDDDDFAFGGRIPVGVEWKAREIPIGVSLEIVPGLVIIPETDAFVQGGLAVRYYFK